MKLIFCKECHDVVKLDYVLRYCKCSESYGWYKNDGLHAVIMGPCVPLGISNEDLQEAIRWRLDSGRGTEFTAFVIPKKCDTIERV